MLIAPIVALHTGIDEEIDAAAVIKTELMLCGAIFSHIVDFNAFILLKGTQLLPAFMKQKESQQSSALIAAI